MIAIAYVYKNKNRNCDDSSEYIPRIREFNKHK